MQTIAIAAYGASRAMVSGQSHHAASGSASQSAKSPHWSSVAPNSVTCPRRRARTPSSTSVASPSAKTITNGATALCQASRSRIGTNAMRSALSPFGTFRRDSAIRRTARRAQQQEARDREQQRQRQTREPAVSLRADSTPDEVTQRDVERVGGRRPEDPRSLEPEAVRADQEDRPVERSGEQ